MSFKVKARLGDERVKWRKLLFCFVRVFGFGGSDVLV